MIRALAHKLRCIVPDVAVSMGSKLWENSGVGLPEASHRALALSGEAFS